MFWLTYTASPQLLRCTSRLCFGTSPLFIVYYSAELTHFIIRTCLGSIADWMTSNLLCFNSSKTKFLLLGLKPQLDKIQSPALCLSNGVSVLPSASARNLGFIFDSNLTLADQISSVTRSCFYHIRDLGTHSPCSRFHYCSVYSFNLLLHTTSVILLPFNQPDPQGLHHWSLSFPASSVKYQNHETLIPACNSSLVE